MTSTDIYTPFTYCLTFLPTGERYYGVRYAKDCHPSQLWTTYFTSSIPIADLIEEHGKDSFSIQIRKTFITAEQARSWETKFLTRIDAAKHPEWLNGHNGGKNFHSTPESIQKGKDTREKNGTLHPMKNPESVQKRKDTLERNGTESPMKNPESVQKWKDSREKNGTENPMKNPETIQKAKDTRKRNGTERPMKNPETIQKAKDTRKRNGTTNTNSPESIQKAKDTKERNGRIHPSKIPFLSMIYSKKTYSKGNISTWFPELKQYY